MTLNSPEQGENISSLKGYIVVSDSNKPGAVIIGTSTKCWFSAEKAFVYIGRSKAFITMDDDCYTPVYGFLVKHVGEEQRYFVDELEGITEDSVIRLAGLSVIKNRQKKSRT